VCLILCASAAAWAQRPDQATRARLRTRIAALRAEVELLRAEHDADAEHLKAASGDLRKLADLEKLEAAKPEAERMIAGLKAKHGDDVGPNAGSLAALPGFGAFLANQERAQKVENDLNLAMLKMFRPMVEREAKEFAVKTAALHEKALELDDLEAEYRATAPPAPRAEAAPRLDRPKIRAEVQRLRAEVETLQLDYDLARADLMEDAKLIKGMALAGGLMSALGGLGAQAPVKTAQANDAEARKAEREAKKADDEQAAYIADKKKELARIAGALAAKRLDLEDAERRYREPEAPTEPHRDPS
jgi:hypothetical protein